MATLLSPDGRPYTTADRAEITRLKALGYTEQPQKPPPEQAGQKPPPSKKASTES